MLSFPWSYCMSFLSFYLGGGRCRFREQVQYLCLISHSSNNSRPSIYHMDMLCLCLWPHTLRGCRLLPFHPLVAVPAFWPSPVPWEASPTFQLKMRRSTMTVITKEVSHSLWDVSLTLPTCCLCHCLFCFSLDLILPLTKQRISAGR